MKKSKKKGVRKGQAKLRAQGASGQTRTGDLAVSNSQADLQVNSSVARQTSISVAGCHVLARSTY